MWNADDGFFYTGSNDGKTIDTVVVLEEVQSESYLALLDRRYADALDWTKTNLIGTDTPQSLNSSLKGNLRLSGVSFSGVSRRATERASPTDPLPDPDAVWWEGTAQMAAALLARGQGARRDLPTFNGDLATAAEYISQITLAQSALGLGQNQRARDSQWIRCGRRFQRAQHRNRVFLLPEHAPRRHDVVPDRCLGEQPVPVVSLQRNRRRRRPPVTA